MKREILFSLALHLAIVAATVVSAPFEIKKSRAYDEIIRVSLISLPSTIPSQAPEPIAIPQALSDVLPEISIDDPTTTKEAIVKPKKEKDKKPQPKTTGQVGSEGVQEESGSSRTGGGSLIIDNPSFNSPTWEDLAWNQISSNFHHRVVYDGILTCDVYVEVIGSGLVIEARVVKKSGIPDFDRYCRLAVPDRLPPLPKDFREEFLKFIVFFSNRKLMQ